MTKKRDGEVIWDAGRASQPGSRRRRSAETDRVSRAFEPRFCGGKSSVTTVVGGTRCTVGRQTGGSRRGGLVKRAGGVRRRQGGCRADGGGSLGRAERRRWSLICGGRWVADSVQPSASAVGGGLSVSSLGRSARDQVSGGWRDPDIDDVGGGPEGNMVSQGNMVTDHVDHVPERNMVTDHVIRKLTGQQEGIISACDGSTKLAGTNGARRSEAPDALPSHAPDAVHAGGHRHPDQPRQPAGGEPAICSDGGRHRLASRSRAQGPGG